MKSRPFRLQSYKKKRDNHLPLTENFNLKSNTMKNTMQSYTFFVALQTFPGKMHR